MFLTNFDTVDEELAQAKARAVFLLVAVIYLAGTYLWADSFPIHKSLPIVIIVLVAALYVPISIFLIKRYPGHYPLRRIASLFVDLGTTTTMLYVMGALAAAFYPLYLWIIIGNGIRFGLRYLIIAQSIGVIGFIFVITHNDYWLENPALGGGLLVGSLILPLFFVSLIRRLHALNEQLDKRVRERTEIILEAKQKEMEMERQLTQSRKLQSMGSLLGGIAHSMNNHLVPIKSLAYMVKSELPEGSEEAKDLERVISAASSASDMLRKVLNFTRQDEHQGLEECLIGETVNVAVELASTAIPGSIRLIQEIEPIQEYAPISRVDLEIIVLNMITNSVDAMGSGYGKVCVSLSRMNGDHAESAEGDSFAYCLRIKDDGVGMSDSIKNRMFDPFFTTKVVGKGTGLGLSETWGIVSKAGGRIEVDSLPDEGTEIAIYLPRAHGIV